MLGSAGSAVRESGTELQGSFCRGKDLKKYDRDRDWPVETVVITGLRENSGRVGWIGEPYLYLFYKLAYVGEFDHHHRRVG